jgi:hypothetical protein
MSNKSARPVKTHEENLIDKAQKAIKEFWHPESDITSQDSQISEDKNEELQQSQSTGKPNNEEVKSAGKKPEVKIQNLQDEKGTRAEESIHELKKNAVDENDHQ